MTAAHRVAVVVVLLGLITLLAVLVTAPMPAPPVDPSFDPANATIYQP